MTIDSRAEVLMPTPQRRLIGCWMSALALAMRCKLGEADDDLLRRVCIMSAVSLSEGDPLRAAIGDLHRQWPHLRRPHQTEAMKAAGDVLMRAVERSSWPTPSDRVDLDG